MLCALERNDPKKPLSITQMLHETATFAHIGVVEAGVNGAPYIFQSHGASMGNIAIQVVPGQAGGGRFL